MLSALLSVHEDCFNQCGIMLKSSMYAETVQGFPEPRSHRTWIAEKFPRWTQEIITTILYAVFLLQNNRSSGGKTVHFVQCIFTVNAI